VETW